MAQVERPAFFVMSISLDFEIIKNFY